MSAARGGRLASVPIDADATGPGLFLPEPVVIEVERLLRTYGDGQEHEGIVYLGGVEAADAAVAVVALSPDAQTTRGSFRTDLDANASVVQALGALDLSLVGQVHSHPGRWVDHSDGDDEGALVRFQGYWSIVVPSFARDGMQPLARCGVHVFRDGEFKRLTEAAIAARIRIIPASVDLRETK